MSQSEQGGAGRREVAYRLFAEEYDDADFSYSESDEERAPNYVVTPSGARVNRLFVVGVLTEVEQVNEEVLRARVVDPTGAFVVYAGQYQPDELAFLDGANPPTFVALTGKARTFQPDDADTVYTSVRPESISEVDAETRDRWTVQTAEQTLARVATMADALGREERGDDLRDALVAAGVDEGLAAGTAMAVEHYGTTPTYLEALREMALDAARVVAGELDEVDSFSVSPDASGSVTPADLPDLDSPVAAVTAGEAPTDATDSATVSGADTTTGDATDSAGSTAGSTDADTDSTETRRGESGTDSEPVETPAGGEAAETTAGAESSGEGIEESAAASADTEPAGSGTVDSTPDTGTTESTADTASGASDEEEIGDFEPGEFELDEEEREEIEEEYGTDFSTGTEVDDPGEADIEPEAGSEEPDATPESEAQQEPVSESESEPEPEPESEPEPEPESESESETEPEVEEAAQPAEPDTSGGDAAGADEETGTDEAEADTPDPEDVDLPGAVMDAMEELDDGDGADRDALIERVVDQYGVDPGEVEGAIEDALMDGRCYEPDDTTLKPI